MLDKFKKLLEESRESDNTIARNNGVSSIEVKKWRVGKAIPEEAILKKVIAYFKKGGDSYIKAQQDPLKELQKQNKALKYFIKSKGYSLREVGV